MDNTHANELKKFIKWAKNNKVDVPNTPEEMFEVSHLDMKLKEISKLPEEIGYLTNLTSLDVRNNRISLLPKEISNLTNLKTLNLARNQFSYFPIEVIKLINLEELDIESNKLTMLPPEIGRLTKLRKFNLFYNQLKSLPNEIGNMISLEELNLSSNHLTELPESMGKLINLVELGLWSNKITQIPDSVRNLPKLHDVDLSLNQTKLNHKLIEAAVSDNIDLAREMIAHGANVNFKWMGYGNLPFTTALFEAKSVDMVKLLIEHKADLTVKREKVKAITIKVWESENATGEFETFLTQKHSLEIAKYIKTLK